MRMKRRRKRNIEIRRMELVSKWSAEFCSFQRISWQNSCVADRSKICKDTPRKMAERWRNAIKIVKNRFHRGKSSQKSRVEGHGGRVTQREKSNFIAPLCPALCTYESLPGHRENTSFILSCPRIVSLLDALVQPRQLLLYTF